MESSFAENTTNRIAFIGNYLPRQCGIATFTTDLCENMAQEFRDATCIAIPVNDIAEGYAYPPRVRFELAEQDLDSYRRAADYLNINKIDLVCLQHEYGIYGGKAGSHIVTLLEQLHMPVVTTCHTILQEPDSDQLRVLKDIAALSDRMVVMSERGAKLLHEVFDVVPGKIDVIPHGIPDLAFIDPSFHKDAFNVEGKIVILSFGLLSANKGYENMIQAMPRILAQFPNVVYIILGATHPAVKRNEGEAYRNSLSALAKKKGVDGNVIFVNKFVRIEELIEYIGAADIYVTPYRDEAQSTSGTLAYTIGAGKAVVSTPYWYAAEMLAEERGVLVPFNNPKALADQIIDLLQDEPRRAAIRKKAYLFGREMIWPQVSRMYMDSFSRARRERRYYSDHNADNFLIGRFHGDLPPIKLDHLKHMTDDTGMLQHAISTLPNYREGYTTDDNARALMVAKYLQELGCKEGDELLFRYMSFMWYAYNPDKGRFQNFMSFQRQWVEDIGSDDCHGRSLWALGTVVSRINSRDLHDLVGWLFMQALPAIRGTSSPRAWAFALLGIHEYLRCFAGDRNATLFMEELSGKLMDMYRKESDEDWKWFESSVAYCNAVFPHAMIACGNMLNNQEMTKAGLDSLRWLLEVQRPEGMKGNFVPVGSQGFYPKGGERARYDQQPVEAQCTVSACLEAYRITHNKMWYREARRAFDWFLGRNDLKMPLYDTATGGCRDGMHADRLNENQGAESTLAFLQSLLELKIAENKYKFDEVKRNDK